MVERVPPPEATADRVRSALTTLLEQNGFEPEPLDDDIRMCRCPFHELAESHPDVVCAVHRGLVSGALEALGGELAVDHLRVFSHPGACVLRLRTARPASRSSS
jgi:predicted ArsR family transcriptional regulator